MANRWARKFGCPRQAETQHAYPFIRFHTLFLLGKSPQALAERTGFKAREATQDGEHIVFERLST